jgi:hypothetical protein
MNRSTLRVVILVLAAVTAIVHLALGIGGIVSGQGGAFNIMFVLNGVGYFALLAALFLPGVPVFGNNRAAAHYLMIAYTALTFVLYFVFNGFSEFGTAAIVAKSAELLLIIATVLHLNAAE